MALGVGTYNKHMIVADYHVHMLNVKSVTCGCGFELTCKEFLHRRLTEFDRKYFSYLDRATLIKKNSGSYKLWCSCRSEILICHKILLNTGARGRASMSHIAMHKRVRLRVAASGKIIA